MPHAVKIALWILGGGWLYTFIGAIYAKKFLEEETHMIALVEVLCAIVLWPMLPIFDVFNICRK